MDRPAVGSCKQFLRGLHIERAALVGDTRACGERHDELITAANVARAVTLLQGERTGAGYVQESIFHGLVVIVLAGPGVSLVRFLGPQAISLTLIGIFLLHAAIPNLLEARKYRQKLQLRRALDVYGVNT